MIRNLMSYLNFEFIDDILQIKRLKEMCKTAILADLILSERNEFHSAS